MQRRSSSRSFSSWSCNNNLILRVIFSSFSVFFLSDILWFNQVWFQKVSNSIYGPEDLDKEIQILRLLCNGKFDNVSSLCETKNCLFCFFSVFFRVSNVLNCLFRNKVRLKAGFFEQTNLPSHFSFFFWNVTKHFH